MSSLAPSPAQIPAPPLSQVQSIKILKEIKRFLELNSQTQKWNIKKEQSWRYNPNAPTTTTPQLFNINIKVKTLSLAPWLAACCKQEGHGKTVGKWWENSGKTAGKQRENSSPLFKIFFKDFQNNFSKIFKIIFQKFSK